jgi:hypothetical protein
MFHRASAKAERSAQQKGRLGLFAVNPGNNKKVAPSFAGGVMERTALRGATVFF